MGQSTNDMFPTAIHVAVAAAIHERLVPALSECGESLADKAAAVGQDHQDRPHASGRRHAAAARAGVRRLRPAIAAFGRTGRRRRSRPCWNCRSAARRSARASTRIRSSAAACARFWPSETGIPFVEAANHFEANAQRDGLVECHGQLRTIAVTLFNVANNIRWLGSGPRCGFYEIKLPDRQPGSSIMPGKVNPVMCESLMQVAARVMGNDQTVAISGAAGGQFQLNIMMPVMADHAGKHPADGRARMPSRRCVLRTWKPTRRPAKRRSKSSLAMVTALNPNIGYEKAAALAKEAFKTGKTIRELCQEKKILPEDELSKVLDPRKMIRPS